MQELIETVKEWFLHLFTPHCEACRLAKECKNCDYLRLMIEQERAEKSRLLSMLTEDKHDAEEVDPYIHVKRFTPMSTKLRQLEREHRKKEAEGGA